MIKFYRKRPVIISAIIWGSTDHATILEFFGPDFLESVDEQERLRIPTLEGTMLANIGDYIIKGVNGEFYPCKPDIFLKTYENMI